ncbi:ABC transporter ATP-binding protein [Dietzia maris]|uniref:ABC transporter ATP-binding protein n=1 Tax=Dietzia maris TaxID=37915 RepID=UPI00223BCE28|nr:ABC transporter ATP-binding protein [Dietzia maris]MCT1434014.1 ABC transporter ATP-binding protein [Dietzia maris]MCT1521090.1 ABC transporter ATP-binding protein [Dietzia maris]
MSATDHASTASPATTLVEVTGLLMTYGATTALDGLDMTLAPGQIVGLLGENGCGKTTLLKILAGVLAGYSGDVRIAGHVPGPESKALVSYLPDTSFLPDAARVSYCLELYTDFFADFQPEKARDLIGFFGLSESARLKQMSKGMREKVQIALAMSRDARVFLLDEPISGVDPAARQVILDGIVRNLSEDSLLLITTHLVHDLEPILDAAVMMRHGRVLLSGDADDLRGSRGASLDQIFRETYR